MKRIGSNVVIEVEDVIRPEKVDEYNRDLQIVYSQLQAIANNLIIMEQITNFPYHLFLMIGEGAFWSLASKAFFDSTVLAFATVLAKTGDGTSLRRFKNKVLKVDQYRIQDIDKEVSTILHGRIKEIDFDKRIKSFEEAIKNVRNQHIAHLDSRKTISPEELVPYGLPLSNLKQALDLSNRLFQVLGLGTYYKLEFWGYTGSREKVDIEKILEMVAARSYWFSEDPDIDFASEYEKLNDRDKSLIDEWRKKLHK